MDEFETVEAPVAGGLSQASTAPAASPAVAPAQASVAQPSEYDKAMAVYQKQRQELLATQQRLIESLESRVSGPQEMLWGLAQAFSAPTRTGSFGESFGHATQALGQHFGKQQQQISDIAKMRAEMAAQQVGMAKEDVELAKTQQLSNALTGLLSGKASPDSIAATGITREQASLIANMPSEYKAMIIAQLQTGDVKGAVQELQKYMLEQTKEPEKIKELRYYISQLQSPAAKAIAQQLAANNYFLGSPAERNRVILDIRKASDAGEGITRQEADILIGGLTNIGGAPVAPIAAPSAALSAPATAASPAGFPRISPEEQAERDRVAAGVRAREQTGEGIPTSTIISPKQERDVAAKVAETEAVDRAKSRSEDRLSLKKGAEEARSLVNDANAVFDLAKTNPNAFGILSKPGISNAFLTAVENGIRVGNFSVGLNDLQASILRAGGTQQDIDAAAALGQIAVKTSLELSSAVKGSVSNYEQDLFKQASFSKNDSPAVLKYKSELMRARGEIQKFLWNKYLEFEKAGKGNIEDFKSSKEYKSYQNQYDSALSKIRQSYFK